MISIGSGKTAILAMAMAILALGAGQAVGQSPSRSYRQATQNGMPTFHLGSAIKSAFSKRSRQTPLPQSLPVISYAETYQAGRVPEHMPSVHAAILNEGISQVQYISPETIAMPIAGTISGPVSHSPATPISASYSHAGMCPCGYCGQPFGSSIDAYFGTHIQNGERARLTLYHYDFNNGPLEDQTQLNAGGLRKLARLKGLMESSGHPLLIQHVENDMAISQARQANVTRVLQTELGLPATEVLIGEPHSRGLRGPEAIDMNRSRQQIMRAMGDTQSGSQANSGSNASSGQGIRER